VEGQALYKIRLHDGREFGPADMDLIMIWARQGRVPKDALLVPEDGSPVQSVLFPPQLAAILQAPPTVSTGLPEPKPPTGGDETVATIVPYRNPPALFAYYFGVFSILPPLGIPAFILGIIGLRRRAADPQLKGAAHAWIGIILGGFFTLLWIVAIILILLAASTP
jgi:hypothetical protein